MFRGCPALSRERDPLEKTPFRVVPGALRSEIPWGKVSKPRLAKTIWRRRAIRHPRAIRVARGGSPGIAATLDQLARARKLPIVATYAENASAARRWPEFDRMMTDARRGAFSVLLRVVSRPRRALDGRQRERRSRTRPGGRGTPQQAGAVAGHPRPVRDLLLAIFSWVAEQEIRRLVERMCCEAHSAEADCA